VPVPRVAEGTSAVLILPMLFGAFQPPGGPAIVFPWAENQETLHRPGDGKDVPVTIECVSRQILLSGFGGRKAPSSMGKISTAEVLRLRATSAVSRDQSVRRSAQDDDFVGILTKNIRDKLALMGQGPGLAARIPNSPFQS
jgi:hypothetical protein